MSAWPCENVATRLVATGLSSFSNSARMRSSTASTEPIWVKVPRPISAARVIRKEFGAEPMPTMNTRERPRWVAIVSSSCCSLPMAPSVRNTIWRRKPESAWRGSVSAAFIAGSISVPPCAWRAPTKPSARRTCSAIGSDRVREEHVHRVVEADHVEAVGRLEAPQRVKEARLRLHHRGAAHRARVVDHEDDLARAAVLSLLERGWRHEREDVIGVPDPFAEKADRGDTRRSRLPGQLEIAVGRHRPIG